MRFTFKHTAAILSLITLAVDAQVCAPVDQTSEWCAQNGTDGLLCSIESNGFDTYVDDYYGRADIDYMIAWSEILGFKATTNDDKNPIRPSSCPVYLRANGIASMRMETDTYPISRGELRTFDFACAHHKRPVPCNLTITVECDKRTKDGVVTQTAYQGIFEYTPDRKDNASMVSVDFSATVAAAAMQTANYTVESKLGTNFTFEAGRSDGSAAVLYRDNFVYNWWYSRNSDE